MENIIVNADCFQYLKSIPSGSVDLVLTDPPYGVYYISNRRKLKTRPIVSDDNTKWFKQVAIECYRVLKDNTHLYMFSSIKYINRMMNKLKEAGFKVGTTLVWLKNNHTSGDLYYDFASKTEYIIYARKGTRLFNSSKRPTNLLYFKKENCNLHPTQKPVNLLRYLIMLSSVEGEVVLDPFCGSGSTLIAAHELNRFFIGIEIDSEYYEVAKNRLSGVNRFFKECFQNETMLP